MRSSSSEASFGDGDGSLGGSDAARSGTLRLTPGACSPHNGSGSVYIQSARRKSQQYATHLVPDLLYIEILIYDGVVASRMIAARLASLSRILRREDRGILLLAEFVNDADISLQESYKCREQL